MKKIIKLLNYKGEPKEVVIDGFEQVALFRFAIISGDGTLDVIYSNNKVKHYDSDNGGRLHDFYDESYYIAPQKIDVLNSMKNNYDTNKVGKASLDVIGVFWE